MIVDLEMRCVNCPLWKRPYVPSDTTLNPAAMAVGLMPGATEEQIRRPFKGDIGSTVREVMGGIFGKDVYYTNVMKRRPLDDNGNARKPTQDECSHCGHRHLSEEIAAFKPPIVITFGQMATSFVYGHEVNMDDVHGLCINVQRFGYTFKMMPMYDPGYVARKGGLMSATGDVWLQDLEGVRDLV